MEFFATAQVRMSASDIQHEVTISTLHDWCASIENVRDVEGSRGKVKSLWGEFGIHRELIGNGVRFTFPSSPCGLQWTLTADPGNLTEVQIYASANRHQLDDEMLRTLEIFITDWRAGLEEWPVRRAAKANKPCVNCGDSFGGFG